MLNKNNLIVIFLIAIMIMGMILFLPINNNSASGSGISAAPSPGLYFGNVHSSSIKKSHTPFSSFSKKQMALRAIELANQSNTPLKDVFLPNFASVSGIKAGHITLGYSQSPAPMGIGFYGLYNNSGTTEAKNYTFPDLAAHVNLTQLQTMYLADGAPQDVSFQLNAVLSNVNLFGNSSYALWTQNVIFYSARTHQISFDLNIWNFSSPAVTWSHNSIYSSTGNVSTYPGAYIVLGPTYQLSNSNLNITLYLNTSLVGGRQALDFNYSLTGVQGTSGVVSGTYDQAVFNSSTNAKPLHYLVSGTNLTPTGFIPYDAEIMVGGPGGGSTANILNITGSMNLMYMNTTTSKFQNVPNAYDIGSETGETSVGVDVHYTGSTAMLTSGPSMVYGLWNETNSAFSTYHVQITNASDSYVFVGQNSTAAGAGFWNWAPVNYGKNQVYYLPTSAKYPFEVLSNLHNMVGNNVTYLNLTTTTNVNLVSNIGAGIYTPLIADGNAQLSSVATLGSGTAASPYVLALGGCAALGGCVQINTVFGQLNDYAFPTFPGVLIYNTNAHANVVNFDMKVIYTGVWAKIATCNGLPSSNGMNMWIYNSSNITVQNGVFSSWYSYEQTGSFEGSLATWNSTNLYISGNSFPTWSMGAFSYNPPSVKSNITYTGNTFYDNAYNSGIPLSSPYYYSIMCGSSPTGLMLFSNNTSVSSNYFCVENPVQSSDYNYYTGRSANYSGDSFNGNYWWNYNGKGPYTNFGKISTGAADNTPLILHGANITLKVPTASTQAGVGVTANYVVTFNGLMVKMEPAITGSSSLLLFNVLAPKAPSYSIFTIESTDYVTSTMNSAAGSSVSYSFQNSICVDISSRENFTFNLFSGNLTISNTNPDGSSWAPVLNGVVQTSTTAQNETISGIPYGAYFVGANANGQTSDLANFTILSSPAIRTTVSSYPLIFKETGLSSGTSWSVNVNGITYSSGTSSISLNVPANTYNYSITPPSGYTVSNGSGTVSVKSSTAVSVSFIKTMFKLTFTETGLAIGTTWDVTVNGHKYTNDTTTITISVPYGTASYKIGNISGYTTDTGSSTISVAGNNQISVSFSSVSSAISSAGLPEIGVTLEAAGVALVVGILVGILVITALRKKS